MKILHVIPSISHVHGGPSIALETMTRALVNAGVEVEVATTNDDGARLLAVRLGEPMLRAGVTHWFFPRQTWFYKISLPLARWLRKNVAQYDVVHIHALFSFASTAAAYAAAQARAPYVVRPLGTLNRYGMTQRRASFKAFSYRWVERRILQHAARVHYTSAQERDEAEELGSAPPCSIIPVGIDTEALANIERARVHGAPLRILFLARLDAKKGVDVLLDAFARLCARGCAAELTIAGDGDAVLVENLKRHAESLGVVSHVTWRGFVQGDAKRAELERADVFVLPSHSENFGIAVAEAMAAGLPVVVTPQVGIAREIVEQDAGVLVTHNSERIADAFEALAQNETRRLEMGARGKRLAQEKFSVKAMLCRMIEMYERVIREAGLK